MPHPINERKPGLHPGEFRIPAVKTRGDFELLLVERCTHPVYLDETRPRLIVPDPSDQVAQSIVMDYKQSLNGHGYVPEVAEPGLDWVLGEYPNIKEGKDLFAATHAALLREMEQKQLRWFTTLVELADDDWARHHMHKLTTQLQRTAAMALGLQREWLVTVEVEKSMSRCKFCFIMVDPRAVICPSCRMILDPVAHAAMVKGQEAAPTK